jgi:hypothetical protein
LGNQESDKFMRISKKRVLKELLEKIQPQTKRFHTLEQVELEKNPYLGSRYWDLAAYTYLSFTSYNKKSKFALFEPKYNDLEMMYVFVEVKNSNYIINVVPRVDSSHYIRAKIHILDRHFDGRLLWTKDIAAIGSLRFQFALLEEYCNLPNELFNG